jgi:hypothetical protein
MIRIAWELDFSRGHGEWHPASVREALQVEIDALCGQYGEGTHWIEEQA